MAAVLAVPVDRMLQRFIWTSVFWTDSMTVLRYIQNETKRFHTFVENRVAVTRDSKDVEQRRRINSSLNQADEASWGKTF